MTNEERKMTAIYRKRKVETETLYFTFITGKGIVREGRNIIKRTKFECLSSVSSVRLRLFKFSFKEHASFITNC